MRLYKLFLVLLSLLFFVASPVQGDIAFISAVEFERYGDWDNITISTGGWIKPDDYYSSEPLRFTLIFKGATIEGEVALKDIDSPRIEKIIASQKESNIVEVAFYLKREIRYEVINIFGRDKTIIEITDGKSVVKTPEEEEKEAEEKEAIKEIKGKNPFPVPALSKIPNFKVKVDSKDFSPGKVPQFQNGVLLVKATDFFGLLDLSLTFNKNTKTYTIQRGDEIRIDFKANTKRAKLNLKPVELDAVPTYMQQYRGKPLFIPLISFAELLGYGASWDKKSKTLLLNPKLEDISIEEKDIVKIMASLSMPLEQDRTKTSLKNKIFVLDLNDVFIGGEIEVWSEKKEWVKKIKVYQYNPRRARIVAYLKKSLPYTVVNLGKEEKVGAIFAPAIKTLKSTKKPDHFMLEIFSTDEMNLKVYTLTHPDRIVIDIPNTIYKATDSFKVLSGIVNAVRTTQYEFDPPLSRIVIDLEKSAKFKKFLSKDKRKASIIVLQPTVVKKKAPAKSYFPYVKGKTIVIEPAHGGIDPGGFGYSGRAEKHASLQTGLMIARVLSKHGANVILTREKDIKIPRKRVVSLANNSKADIFISVHYNSFDSSWIGGIETYYFTPQSKFLAQIMQWQLVKELKRKNRGIRKVTFYTIHHTKMPAVLIEPGYITNKHEEKLANSPWYQEKVAIAVLKALNRYFKTMR